MCWVGFILKAGMEAGGQGWGEREKPEAGETIDPFAICIYIFADLLTLCRPFNPLQTTYPIAFGTIFTHLVPGNAVRL